MLCLTLGTLDALARSLPVQFVISAITWAVFLLMLILGPTRYRVPAIVIVLVATDFECFGSLLCGFYQYRLHNLPLYVPAGHGIFYLAARQVLDLAELQRHRKLVVRAVFIVSAAWMLHGLFISPHPDLEGAIWWMLLAYFLWRRRDPLLYAVTFVLTMGLEYYGTASGAWHWAASLPGTGLPSGNPPSACAAGYCVLDASAMRLVRLWQQRAGVRNVRRNASLRARLADER